MPGFTVGAYLYPRNLPFLAADRKITAIEWTSEIVLMGVIPHQNFRVNFANLRGIGVTADWGTNIATFTHKDIIPEDAWYSRVSPNPSAIGAGCNIGWGAAADLYTNHLDKDGVKLLAPREPTAKRPGYARYWQDIDLLVGTSASITNRPVRDLWDRLPETVGWRAIRVGFVTNPPDQLYRDANTVTGDWVPLGAASDGNGYAIWRVSNSFAGEWRDTALYYLPKRLLEFLHTENTLTFVPEWATSFPAAPTLSASPSKIIYSGMRMFDVTTSAWHELLDWQIPVVIDGPADTDGGWSVSESTGKLASICGTPGEMTLNRWQLAGFTYQGGASYTDLAFVDVRDTTEGGITYNGSIWMTGAAAPYVQQDADRGLYLLSPDGTTPASVSYTAPVKATYTFTGDFARANDTMGAGDGTDVEVIADGESLFTAHVVDGAAVDGTSAATIFAGASNQTFSVSKALEAGAKTRFVATGTAAGTNTTAFRCKVKFVRLGSARTPVDKTDPMFTPQNWMFRNARNAASGTERLVSTMSLRHECFFFSDVDDGEIWKTTPDGIVAFAIGQSESDASADVQMFLNEFGAVQASSTLGNRKLWLHCWSRASLRSADTGTNVPPESSGQGFIPRGRSMFTNDLTLAGDNLNNGRIVSFAGYRHSVYGFRDLVTGDTYVGKSGIVATAWQPNIGKNNYMRTSLVARDSSSTTIQFSFTELPLIDGWLHCWSR